MAIGSQVATGAKLELKIAGVTVAYASNCSYTVNHNHQPIEVFNETTVNEYAELGITCEFSASMFRVANKAAISLGLQPTIANFLVQPELTMTIKDKVSGAVLVRGNGIKITSRAGTMDARGTFSETLNFVARVISDEQGQEA